MRNPMEHQWLSAAEARRAADRAVFGDLVGHVQQIALAQIGIAATQAHLARTLGTRMGVGIPFSAC